jgi:hypothetical protein
MANQSNTTTGNQTTGGKGGDRSTGTSAQPKRSAASGEESRNITKAEGSNTGSGEGILQQAKSTAGQAYGVAAEKAASKLEEQKATLSGGLSSVAGSIRQVSENLQGPDVQAGIGKFAHEYSDMAAQKIEEAANYFERKDLSDLYRDVERFARRNPGAFIGAAFAIGMLTARFLKSSSPDSGRGNGAAERMTDIPRSENQPTATSAVH